MRAVSFPGQYSFGGMGSSNSAEWTSGPGISTSGVPRGFDFIKRGLDFGNITGGTGEQIVADAAASAPDGNGNGVGLPGWVKPALIVGGVVIAGIIALRLLRK